MSVRHQMRTLMACHQHWPSPKFNALSWLYHGFWLASSQWECFLLAKPFFLDLNVKLDTAMSQFDMHEWPFVLVSHKCKYNKTQT
jgi:hypothetical protein